MLCFSCHQTNRPTAHFCFNCRAPLLLQNKYRLTAQLGRGGYGAVYLAQQTHLGDVPCAIKELVPDPNASPPQLQQAAAQFQFEASILARLSDPALPRVTDFFNEGDRYYLVMEYVEGETLEERLSRIGMPLPEQDVIRWAEVLCDTLTYLHSQNPPVIHRDLKPSNIKLTSQGRVKLLDFGIAKLLAGNTHTAARAVTPPYAPLEQYGKRTDARTDLYALGVTLYQLLTNQLPPEAPDRAVEPLIPPRQINRALSAGTEAAILKTMAMDPVNRFQDAQQFKRALGSPAPASKNPPQGIYTPPPVASPNANQAGTVPMPVPARKNSNGWVWGIGLGIFAFIGIFFLVGNVFRGAPAQPTAAPATAVAAVDTLVVTQPTDAVSKTSIPTIGVSTAVLPTDAVAAGKTSIPTIDISTAVLPTESIATVDPTSEPTLVPTLVPPDTPRILRIGKLSYPDLIDPQKSSFTSEIDVLKLAYEGLVNLDNEGNIIPGAADAWQINGSTMTFHIRDGLERSDGRSLACADFEYALRRQVDPFTPDKQYTSILYDIKGARELDDYAYSTETSQLSRARVNELYENYGVRCLDDRTLQVAFNTPIGFWGYIASTWVTFPTDERSVQRDFGNWSTLPSGHIANGPFRITEINQGQNIVFEANPIYWRGKPNLDRIEFIYNNDAAVLLEAYKNGELDIIAVSPDQIDEVNTTPDLSRALVRYPLAVTFAIAFNQTRSPFDDKNVRLAFSQALDREGYVQQVLNGIGVPYTRWIPPGVPGAQANREGVPGTDAAAALRTLVENGYAAADSTAENPKVDCARLGEIKLTHSDTPLNRARSQFLAENFERVFGCAFPLDPVEPTSYAGLLRSIDTVPQITRIGWIQDYPHPQNWLSTYWTCNGFGSSRTGYCNSEFDLKLEQANSEPNVTRALGLYQEAEDMLMADVPAAFQNLTESLFLVQPWVIGPDQYTSSGDLEWPGTWGPIWEYDIDLSQVPVSYSQR